MRARMRKDGVNKKDRSQTCAWLKKHISYHGYKTPEKAKTFFRNHADEIYSLIGTKGGKLEQEFNQLLEGATTNKV